MNRPSKLYDDITGGTLNYRDAPKPIQSWYSFRIYRMACKVLGLPKEKRLDVLDSCPETYRGEMKTEVRRLHNLRCKK